MNGPKRYAWKALGALTLCGPLWLGCGSLRLPAIDKSGERIFLPPPSSTTLVAPPIPGLRSSLIPRFPQPAFESPPSPPPCPPPLVSGPVGHMPLAAAPGSGNGPDILLPRQAGMIVVSPTRMVAPVGSEVTLTAGLVGSDGQFQTRQPIHWILSQDSAGFFREVSDNRHWFVERFLQRGSGIVSYKYAIGRSTSRAKLISRGTPTPIDDIWVQRGQAWASLTSATAGTSIVHIQAPQTRTWDRRLQTAIIHWIDAQWSFPQPVILQAGQRHWLQTVLSHATDGTAIGGWIVRYELAGANAAASFAPSAAKSAEVTTDANGLAAVEIVPNTNQFSAAQIRIQIIRPGQSTVDLPRLVIGEGSTAVTWTAPGLAINVTGPDVTELGAALTYQIDVSNPGDVVARNLLITGSPSSGVEVVRSTPVASVFGDRQEWRISELAPKTSTSLTVLCRATQRGTQQFCAIATSGQGLKAEACAQTRILVPAIELEMTGPQRAEVGQQVQFQITITNPGDQPLTNVVLTEQFDAGLEHVQGEISPMQKSLPSELQPGASARVAIDFNVTLAGTHCHTLNVRADGGHTAQARSCVTATDPQPVPRPSVQVEITGPLRQNVGQTAHYIMKVMNSGNLPLKDVRVLYQFAPSLAPRQATDRHAWFEGGLQWSDLIPNLDVGQSRTMEVICECLRSDPAAWSRVTVTSDQNVSDSATAQTEIVPAADTSRRDRKDDNRQPIGTAWPLQALPTSGELKVTITNPTNPIAVGSTSEYVIQITNDHDVSDKKITVEVIVSDHLQIRKLDGDALARRLATRSLEIIPIAELRPREQVVLRVETRGRRAGQATFTVKTNSLRSPGEINRARMTNLVP